MPGEDPQLRVLYVSERSPDEERPIDNLEQEDERIQVATVDGATKCLERLTNERIDCILADYASSDQNGIELLVAVRDKRPQLPFILLTDGGTEAIASEAISAGVTGYVRRAGTEYSAASLAHQITDAVSDYRTSERNEEIGQRLQELSEVTNDVLWVATQDWSELLFVNAAYEDLWGLSRAELDDNPLAFLDGIHPDDRERVQTAMERVSNGTPADTEFRVNAEVDYQKWAWAQAEPITDDDGNVVRIAGFVRDITERKAHERKLEARSTAIEASIDGIAILDSDEKYVFVNDAHADIYGYEDPDAFLGETWRQCYSDDELERFETEVMPTLFDTHRWRGTAVGTRNDGSTFPQELSLSALPDGRVICVVRDITDRVEQERELERANERLEEFSSIVSHELQNPLQVAMGRLELVQNECDSTYIEDVAAAHDRMEALIDELLTLAQEGDAGTDREPLDLATIAETCWERIETTDATLVTDTDQTISADQRLLRQLLKNLLTNAITHGGPAVTVTIGDLPNGFYVTDDGSGLPADDPSKVFETGYSTRTNGTGFGLTIVEEFADSHGWEVTATESATGGARFEITGVEATEPA